MAFTMTHRIARTTAAPAARRAPAAAPRAGVRARYTVTLQFPTGEEKSFECAPEQLILEAAEANGIELPHMCRTGTCCTCCGRRVKGEVVEPDQGLLSPEFEEMGFALMCSSYPRSDLVIKTHAEEDFIQTSHIYDKQMNLAGAK